MNGKIVAFTDLEAWKKSHILVLSVYIFSKKFPKEEIFGLTNQMRRASVSITSNIAEGFGRYSYKERIYFYYLAHGSLNELKSQVILAKDLTYLTQEEYLKIMEEADIAHKFLQGLIKKSKTFLSSLS